MNRWNELRLAATNAARVLSQQSLSEDDMGVYVALIGALQSVASAAVVIDLEPADLIAREVFRSDLFIEQVAAGIEEILLEDEKLDEIIRTVTLQEVSDEV